MRHLLSYLLFAYGAAAVAQVELPEPLPYPDLDPDVMQGGPAWLVGDHVKARQHFRAAAQRGNPLGQYNLAMMLLHREGGPCGSAEAVSLLRKSADAGIVLASEALDQMRGRGTAHQGVKVPFACPLPTQARSTPSAGPLYPAAAR